MKRYLAVLGRQAEISLAELDALFSDVKRVGVEVATFGTEESPDINRLGGTVKIAKKLPRTVMEYLMGLPDGKITLGVSDYSKGASARSSGAEALKLKKILVRQGRSVRVLPNKTAVIASATSHHNQLGEKQNHVELIRLGKEWWRVIGVQNISAYARRDQARPARDAKVGMLPPKLAQILINLCGPLKQGSVLLDPFCGTGVVLQEAILMGLRPLGSDVEPRMVEYSVKNLDWALKTLKMPNFGQKWDIDSLKRQILVGDAKEMKWPTPVDAVACECYLGRPMSQPPAEIKLKEEKETCKGIILGFLRNLAGQIESNTPVVIAAPSWLRPSGEYEGLQIIDEIEKMGYNVVKNKFARDGLLYRRAGQVVAREIIVLRKK